MVLPTMIVPNSAVFCNSQSAFLTEIVKQFTLNVPWNVVEKISREAEGALWEREGNFFNTVLDREWNILYGKRKERLPSFVWV